MEARPGASRAEQKAPILRRLVAGGAPLEVDQLVIELGLGEGALLPPLRPRLLLNMISTIDGRARIGGRSGAIGKRADRELFHALRRAVDGVMVGAGTARAERYGRIIRDAAARRSRAERGLAQEPLACIVSARLDLPEDLPLLAEPEARVAILTCSQASLRGHAAHVEYVRAERAGRVDLPAALRALRERYAVGTLLCEGGPHLNSELLAAGLVDELLLTLAPKLVGGGDRAAHESRGQVLRILAGADLDSPAELELLGVAESESQLFLRYGVPACEPS